MSRHWVLPQSTAVNEAEVDEWLKINGLDRAGENTTWTRSTKGNTISLSVIVAGPTQRGWPSIPEAFAGGEALGLNMWGQHVGADLSPTNKDEFYPATHEVYYTGDKNDPYRIREVDTGDPNTTSYSAPYTETDGSLWVYDRKNPNNKIQLSEAPKAGDAPTGGDIQLLKKETLPDGSIVSFYNEGGRIKSYKSSAARDAIQEGADSFDVTGGTFHQTSPGNYTFVRDAEATFTPGNTIAVTGGQLIQTSRNQYQFVRDTYEPGVVEDPLAPGRKFTQNAAGTWTELAPRADPGVVSIGDRDFLQQYTGALSELDPRFDPMVEDVDGMTLLQQRTGAVGQLTPPNMDQIITQALVDGEYDKAFAFQDFRDRPSAAETFQTALQFARSPADQTLISAIARGEQFVAPPPAGEIQRVGPQPDFLVQAYQDFQRRTQAGRAPTGEEIAGASQEPTLQAQLEAIRNKDRREEEKHQLFVSGEEAKQGRAQEVFATTQATKAAESTAKAAAAATTTAAAGDVEQGEPAFLPGETTETVADADKTFSMSDATTADDIQDLWDTGLSQQQRDLINLWDGGIWSFASTSQNMWELKRNLNTHFAQALETTGTAIPHIGRELGGALLDGASPEPVPVDTEQVKEQVKDPVKLDIPAEAPSLFEQRAPARAEIEATLDIMGRGREGGMTPIPASPVLNIPENIPQTLAGYSAGTTFADIEAALGLGETAVATGPAQPPEGGFRRRAGGGTVRPGEITVVGEKGPEIAMMPPGTHILPLGKATKHDIRAAQATGHAYQAGGTINFGELPFGLRQLQAGRPITPSRGYLSQAAGLNLPSAQALQNITPESRDVFLDLAAQAGIPRKSFAQELATTIPSGRRMPVARIAPISRRGIQ